ncbi:MAG TPA: Asp-tRNA(Asn)/Glu-tRNA(Gln) amidotransferase subunit GatA [Candidatus Saccharimonadales bacterium]|nr:Asp-tRNA(Asn)/Glu-tRNA(Gln) amidotransferase subunit GatA [Candidatus Saccharimonadales bacterium]
MTTWPLISEISAAVHNGEISAASNVEKSLDIIAKNDEYRAIIAVTADRARERAKQIDANPHGKLAGVPFIAKDNFLVFGADTTAASNMLRGFVAPYQATAIERLEAEGAICVAKANLDAFAHGASTENSDFYTTLNPRDKTRVPGGSSGGSAAAVALDMAPFALGTDTGGSIRQPASFSGVVGYKPTYGLVSRSGVVAMGSSLDCIGPLTNTVEDAAAILDVIAGKDDLDSTTIDRESKYVDVPIEIKGAKIGIIKEYFGNGLSSNVEAVIKQSAKTLQSHGAEISEVSLPSLPLALAVYYILCPAEVSSNLSRYDGQRYGYSYAEATDLNESYTKSRGIGFGKEAKRRIMIGTYVLSSGYYDAFYKRAQTVRTKIINEITNVFSSVDYLLGPVAPTTAFKIGANAHDPLQMYLADVMTVAANLAGVPAISLPVGDASDGLPVGLQLLAPQKHDAALLGLAKSIEKVFA